MITQIMYAIKMLLYLVGGFFTFSKDKNLNFSRNLRNKIGIFSRNRRNEIGKFSRNSKMRIMFGGFMFRVEFGISVT